MGLAEEEERQHSRQDKQGAALVAAAALTTDRYGEKVNCEQEEVKGGGLVGKGGVEKRTVRLL